MHGRFEEITYQVEESEHCMTNGAPNESSQLNNLHYQEIWDQQESHEHSLEGSRHRHSDEEFEKPDQSFSADDMKEAREGTKTPPPTSNPIQCLKGSRSFSTAHSLYCNISDNYENEVQQELRWLKAKYQMELRELRDQQLGIVSDSSNCSDKDENRTDEVPSLSTFPPNKHSNSDFHDDDNKSCPISDNQVVRYCRPVESLRGKDIITAHNFFTGSLVPHSLHRTTSLPVDAVDI